MGFQPGKNDPPLRVVIKYPDIQYASRHGIAPVAGQVTIQGGHIDHVGYHDIDFEPSTDVEATSIRGVVEGIDLRHHGELDSGSEGYAVAAGGTGRYVEPPIKPSLRIENVTGDDLDMTVRSTASVIVCNNVSDEPTTIDLPGSGHITFIGNVRITPVAKVPSTVVIAVQPVASLKGVPRCLRQLSPARPDCCGTRYTTGYRPSSDNTGSRLGDEYTPAQCGMCGPLDVWSIAASPVGEHLGQGPTVRVSDDPLPGPD